MEAVMFLTCHSVFTAHSTILRPRVCCVDNILSFPRYKSGTALRAKPSVCVGVPSTRTQEVPFLSRTRDDVSCLPRSDDGGS